MTWLTPIVFSLALWLGLYLLARPAAKLSLRLAGAGLVSYALGLAVSAFAQPVGASGTWGALLCFTLTGLCWAGAILPTLRHAPSTHPKRPIRLLLVGMTFLGLSVGAALLSLNLVWLPRELLVLVIGGDVLLLGVAIARLDAFDEGELLWPDLLRSLVGVTLAAVVFGGLMVLAAGFSPWLFVALAAAIAFNVLADRLQTLLDRIVFVQKPNLQQARDELREVAAALPRLADVFDPRDVDEVEFAKLTRRALSHMNDLTKLTTNPLTRLPTVQQRLMDRNAALDPIERATELKQILIECVVRLKPAKSDDTAFGAGEEWRHFNALYYPYVVGLRPYSARVALNGTQSNGLSPDASRALAWFQQAVPERTLYNWQTAAAKLVAQQLRGES